MARFTKASLKSFIKRNVNNLEIRVTDKFDGMYDCVMPTSDQSWRLVDPRYEINLDMRNTLGIDGVWLVEDGRDYFTYSKDVQNGIITELVHVYNSCGSFDLMAIN